MRCLVRTLPFLLLLLIPLLAAADDQQKAHKIVNRVTAMAMDPSGKRAVSLAMSQQFSVPRVELVKRRQAANVNYGDLFVAYELMKSGAKPDDLTARMKTGQTVWQLAEEQHADWKQIENEAKKLSGKVDNHLMGHFSNKKSEIKLERADDYDPSLDTVVADKDVSPQELEEAQKHYVFLRDHATSVSDASLDTSTERAARNTRTDPIRTGGPK
jgi:hypothetical protein